MAFFWYYDTQRGSRSRPLGPTGLRDPAKQHEPVFLIYET
jgi:hypothetical protein